MIDLHGGWKNEHLEHFTVSIFHREREIYFPQQWHPLLHLGWSKGRRGVTGGSKWSREARKELLLFWFCHRYRKLVRDQLIRKKDFHSHCCT